MKRKVLVVLLCAMALAAISFSNAEAAAGWHTCIISKVGASNSYYLLYLTDTAPTPDWVGEQVFIISLTSAEAKAMYATALTAWANSSNVSVYLTAFTPYSSAWGVAAAK
jgi:hypothetical protein